MQSFHRIVWPVACGVLLVAGWRGWGWPGVAFAASAIAMWLLLHLTRTMQVLKRAASQPVGTVASAVMLNARLRPGMPLLDVVGMARALGEAQSPAGAQPEAFRWRDGGGSHVSARFAHGRLTDWELHRPAEEPANPGR